MNLPMPIHRADGLSRPGVKTARRSVHRTRAGFTLLEMLVATIILGALVALMGAAFNQTQRGWLYSSERLDAEQTGRALLQQIATELNQAIATNGLTLACSGDSLAFFATATPSTTNALCELRKIRYALGGSAVLNSLESSELLCGTGGWPNGTGSSITLLSNQVYQLSFECAAANSSFSSTWSSPELPAVVRIQIALVGTRTAARLLAMGGNNRLRDEYLVQLSTMVHLRNAGLSP